MFREPIVFLFSCSILACGPAATPATAAATTSAPSASAAAETPSTPAAPAAGLKAPGEAAIGDRTTCPVSKEEFSVAADSPKVEHGGKTYYFCCAGCDGKFTKDPAKYLGK
jgi:YHS domain-containing protein